MLGEKNATLTIASNAPGGAITVALKATAVRSPAPLVGLSTPALGFGTVTLGTTSVTSRVVLTNTGTAPLAVTSIASSSTEYPTTHDCPASLAVGTSCLISVSFKPATAISTEAVVVTTNALAAWESALRGVVGSAGVIGVGSRLMPPQPPPVHYSVYECDADELRAWAASARVSTPALEPLIRASSPLPLLHTQDEASKLASASSASRKASRRAAGGSAASGAGSCRTTR